MDNKVNKLVEEIKKQNEELRKTIKDEQQMEKYLERSKQARERLFELLNEAKTSEEETTIEPKVTETLSATLSITNIEEFVEALEDFKRKAEQVEEAVQRLNGFELELDIKH